MVCSERCLKAQSPVSVGRSVVRHGLLVLGVQQADCATLS